MTLHDRARSVDRGQVTAATKLTALEVFVLGEVEPEVMLWEIPATRTNNGSEEQRVAVVPALRDAVVSLAERGMIEVYDFPAWPPIPQKAIPVTTATLRCVLDPVDGWLWRGDDTSMLTVAITDTGVTWLSSGFA
jgi:hypothetical protein